MPASQHFEKTFAGKILDLSTEMRAWYRAWSNEGASSSEAHTPVTRRARG